MPMILIFGFLLSEKLPVLRERLDRDLRTRLELLLAEVVPVDRAFALPRNAKSPQPPKVPRSPLFET